MLERRRRRNITNIRLRRRAHATQRRRRRRRNHPSRSSLSFLSFSLFLFLNKRFVCVCNVSSYSTNLSLEYLFFRLSFWANLEQKYNPKKKKRVAAHRFPFLFRVLQILQIFFQTSSCRVREEKKKITCASLIIILVSLFFVSLSRCCFFEHSELGG